MEQNNGKATLATALGIVSLVVAIIGGITFGVIGGIIALVLGILALVFGINAKKETNGEKGQAGFICGLLGVVFAAIFTVGCALCGVIESSETKTSYTCYGCVGGSCMAASDVNKASDDLSDALEELNDALNR